MTTTNSKKLSLLMSALALTSVAGNTAYADVRLEKIDVTPESITLKTGHYQKFKATGTYSDGAKKNVTDSATWNLDSCGDSATIVDSGDTKRITAKAETGSSGCEIEVVLNGVKGHATLKVIPAPALTSIAVVPASLSLAVGQTKQLNAFGTYADGSTEGLTQVVTWTNVDCGQNIIFDNLGNTGLLYAGGEASKPTCTIEATLGGVVGKLSLSVH